MQLQDIQNYVLLNLQQSEMVNFGGAPNWSTATNPSITQNALTFLINRAYMRVIQDLSDIQLALYRWVFSSIANVSDYPLPPNAPPNTTLWGSSFFGSAQLGAGAPVQGGIWGQGQWGTMLWGTNDGPPRIQRITRIIYSPVGQSWSQDFEGGIRLVSWQEFNRRCAFGYLRPFTYGTIPDYAAMTPDRQMISFFPGTANAGDAIGIEYVPELTPNTAWPPLIAEVDVPQMPEETHDLIVLWATALCCPKLKMFPLMKEFQQQYQAEKLRIYDELNYRSTGDTKVIRDANDGLALSYVIGGALIP